jgi:hypothetical protein
MVARASRMIPVVRWPANTDSALAILLPFIGQEDDKIGLLLFLSSLIEAAQGME